MSLDAGNEFIELIDACFINLILFRNWMHDKYMMTTDEDFNDE